MNFGEKVERERNGSSRGNQRHPLQLTIHRIQVFS